jgi:septum formation protein
MSTPLVLASASPRRRELLSILGLPFEVTPSRVDEQHQTGESPEAFVVRTARDKGREVASRLSDAVVVSADTIVTIDGGILGKPVDRPDAIRMLETLSGREHAVMTAVSVASVTRGTPGPVFEGVERTRVWFSPITRPTIEDYVAREDVMDKAGAYAIQGFAATFIPRIDGNYANVVGLPLPLIVDLLSRHGVPCVTSS